MPTNDPPIVWKDQPFLEWDGAFAEEIDALNQRDASLGVTAEGPKEGRLIGLAFSGGGIRSATFNLGVLQALWELDFLKKIDYLSTVSGGGYIGSWFSAQCLRKAGWLNKPADETAAKTARQEWNRSIQHLRRYSNYLSPEVGITSADSWSMAMVWIRNTLLVQITVVLFLAALLLVPRLLFRGFEGWHEVGTWRWITIALLIGAVAGIAGNQLRVSRAKKDIGLLQAENGWYGFAMAACVVAIATALGLYFNFVPFPGVLDCGPGLHGISATVAVALVLAGFLVMPFLARLANYVSRFFGSADPPKEINYSQPWVQWCVVVPMLAASFFVASILWFETKTCLRNFTSFGKLFANAYTYWPFPLTVAIASLGMLAGCAVRRWRAQWGPLAFLAAWIASTVTLYATLCAIVLLMQSWTLRPGGAWHAFIWGPPLVLQAISLSIVILIGMLGRQATEGSREWWSRLGAWFAIYGAAWLIVAVASIYTPRVMEMAAEYPGFSTSAVGGWVLTTIAGLLTGKSASTGVKSEKSKTAMSKEIVAVVAPFVFVAGLFMLVAWVCHTIVAVNALDDIALSTSYWRQMNAIYGQFDWITALLFVACLALLLLFAWRVDINEFSLNAFYRSRLVRCYLGASRIDNPQRAPQRFTEFDDHDDEPLISFDPRPPAPPTGHTPVPAAPGLIARCVRKAIGSQSDDEKIHAYTGPLHIVNCSLNLGGSSDLSVHTRHSAGFTLTPLRCGTDYRSRVNGRSLQLGYVRTREYCGEENTPTLGQAISVSGAAASPNMGYHTSPVVAFLMTVFNARLGWWFPRPQRYDLLAHQRPSPSFSMRYLLAELFGMAHDRSKFLSISDGGHFENLAAYELVKRKCKLIIIGDAECDPEMQFGSLGALIRMCEVDFRAKITIDPSAIIPEKDTGFSHSRCAVGEIVYDDGSKGTLVYLKASLSGMEAASVLQYKASHPKFPHESTADQFYSEDQFESYRSLGFDIAHRTLAPIRSLEADCEKLADIWAPSLKLGSRFTHHTSRLMDFWLNLGKSDRLSDLDQQLTPGWPKTVPSHFRESFYTGSQMLQLMENVFMDLRFDETWTHADNAGWRSMFRTWSQSSIVKEAWRLSYETYGLRFRRFCESELKLEEPRKNAAGAG